MPEGKPRRRTPTSSEVAERAGVSRTTVSFVLNDVRSMNISEATRQRVFEAARELGYEPNAAARSLAGGSTSTVAMLIPRSDHLHVDAFLPRLLAAVNDRCHSFGYKVLLEAAEDQGKVPGAFMNLVRGKRIDGLIIANMREVERPFVEQLARDGFPVVVPGNAADSFHSRGGSFTDAATGRLLTQHLLDLGHRRIAHLAFAQEEFVSVAERRRGYQQALEGAGLSADPALVGYADISAQSGYVAMQKLLASKVPFTALFAGNDTIALGAMCALREAGKRIPKDVAVVGYDDIPLAAFANPSLTTLQIDPIVRGHESADMLHALMTGTHYKRLSSQYPGKLVVRESCGALAAGKLTSAMAEAKSVTPAKSARKAPAKAVRKRAAA